MKKNMIILSKRLFGITRTNADLRLEVLVLCYQVIALKPEHGAGLLISHHATVWYEFPLAYI
jgi:hypothetical protein